MEALIASSAFFIVFPLFWCGIIFLLSRVGGWGYLTSHYAYTGAAKAPQRKNCSLSLIRFRLVPCNYSFIIHMHIDDRALYLSVMKFFAIGHPPLRIPFEDIRVSHRKTGRFSMGQLNILKASNLSIAMPMKDIDWIESEHGSLTPLT